MFKHKKSLKDYLSKHKIKSAENVTATKKGGEFNLTEYQKYKRLSYEAKKKIKFKKPTLQLVQDLTKNYLEWRYYEYILFMFESSLDYIKNNPKNLRKLETKNIKEREKMLLKFKDLLSKLVVDHDDKIGPEVLTKSAIKKIIELMRHPTSVPEIDSNIKSTKK